MKAWTLMAAALLVAGAAAAQVDDNNTTGEEPVGGGNDSGWSPILVLAVVIGLALLIGVIVAVMGRR